MATEPFSTIYFNIPLSVLILYHIALSSLVIAATFPVPSICPETICPPNLPSAAIALSRLTALPLTSLPSDERFNVSCITSAVNVLSYIPVTVRHTPLTAMLSPICVPLRTFSACIVRIADAVPFFTLFTCPISSIIPVNITTLLQSEYRHQEDERFCFSTDMLHLHLQYPALQLLSYCLPRQIS